jgi:integrase
MPAHKFTARSLPPLPKDGQIDYWDPSLPGFGMRVSAGGTRTWVVMYRYNDVKRRMKLGNHPPKALADARDQACEALRKAEKGLDPAAEKKKLTARADSVEELAALYVEQYAKPKKRSWKKDDQILKREVLPLLGRKRVVDVVRQDIRDVLQPIIDREAPIRANHTLEVVRKMYNWAIDTRDLPIANPAARIGKPGEVQSRGRYLKRGELRQFWRALDPSSLGARGAAAFKLLILTAQREMEVVRMRWDDIDWDEKIWTVPEDHAKNQLEHVIPLTLSAVALLADLAREADKDPVFVFGSPIKPREHVRRVFIERRIKKIRSASGIHDVTPHDLRRTVTTYFGKLKVPQAIKKKILNHAKRKRADVTDIYDRYEYLAEKRDALVKWEKLLLEMVQDDKVVPFERARA